MCSGQFDILLLYLDFLKKYHNYAQLSVLAISPKSFLLSQECFQCFPSKFRGVKGQETLEEADSLLSVLILVMDYLLGKFWMCDEFDVLSVLCTDIF